MTATKSTVEETITLKFKDPEALSQLERKRQLDEVCFGLLGRGEVLRVRVDMVFPGDPDPEMASMFTVDITPLAPGAVDEALRQIQRIPGLEYAQRAAPRRKLRGVRLVGKAIPRVA